MSRSWGQVVMRWIPWGVAAAVAMSAAADVIVIKAKKAYPVAGDPIENAVVVVRDGRIEQIGSALVTPDGAQVLDLKDCVLTPGLIDACCVVDAEMPQSARNAIYAEFAARAGGAPTAVDRLRAGCDWTHLPGDCPVCRGEKPSLWVELVEQCEHERAVALGEADHEGCLCAGPLSARQFAAQFASATTPTTTWADQVSEVIPHLRVIDTINPDSTDFARLARSGVTTVFVSPDSASVIGQRGAVVKTGGPEGQRVVRDADAVKASLGADPSFRGSANRGPFGGQATYNTRRPTTRMGVDFVFRKAFYDAIRDGQGRPVGGADTAPAAAFPVLREVLAGTTPLRIQARLQHDIFSALRLAGEFGFRFTLEEGIEAYRALDALKAADVPVIFGPVTHQPTGFRTFVGEADNQRLNTPRRLRDAGVRFALTAQELRDEDGLAGQAMIAVRYGLSVQEALKAVTQTPAELMGLGERVGALRSGADADLVAWTGEPFEATTRIKLVMIGGREVAQNR